MIPRFGEAPQADQSYIRRPGVYAILPRDGTILLTHQADPHPEIQLPGGGVDPGEQPIAALHREVLEETGWSIAAPRRLGVFRRFTWMPEYGIWAEKVCTIYVALPARRLGPPSEVGHTEIWSARDGAADLLGNPGDAAMMRRFLAFGR